VPASTLVSWSVFVTLRSAWPIVVPAVAVLLPGVVSLGELTVAELLIDPLAGAVTMIVMLGASAPLARLPVLSHVTVPDALVHTQAVPLALTKVVPVGRVSTTLTTVAGSGPALCTPIV
jgi:hypothetical protein